MQGATIITTASLEAGQRRRYWADQIKTQFAERMDCTIDCDDDFLGEFMARPVGPANFIKVEGQAQALSHKGSDDNDSIELALVEKGSLELRSFDQCRLFSEGEWFIVDDREDYSFRTSDFCACTVLHLPGAFLRRFVPQTFTGIVGSQDCENEWERALAYALRATGATIEKERDFDGVFIVDHIAGLLSLALGHSANLLDRQKTAILRRLRRTMSQRFSEPELTVEDVARENGISLRYVHKLFASEGQSFGQHLRELRLMRAQQILANPQFCTLSVSEVSQSVGYKDPAHFSELFRKRFGVAPSTFRGSLMR